MNFTPKQYQILKAIHQYKNEHGYAPTYVELARAMKVTTITIYEHLGALERKNAIRRRRHEARSIEIIEKDFLRDQESLNSLPVKGSLVDGALIEAQQSAPVEELPAGALFNCKPNSFLLRVQGRSMAGSHILDGDLIVMEDRETAENGEWVMVDERGQTSFKRYFKENGKIRLQPADPVQQSSIVERCRIKGVLKGLVRRI
jgi:repressor LexA